jgi:signal transduction histidine kinase
MSEASRGAGPRTGPRAEGHAELRRMHASTFSILTIDQDYVTSELLPSLVDRHFTSVRTGHDFRVAVVSRDTNRVVFQSTASFAPQFDSKADATADLFQVRTQDFSSLAAEVRRFVSFSTPTKGPAAGAISNFFTAEARPLSVVIQSGPAAGPLGSGATKMTTTATSSAPRWKLVVMHPSGSLEVAVNAARRRNLLVSFSILGVLGASMGLLVLATRRAQQLATQQMEFVAAVSHELRTPLAVIRSAAENLADGVVHNDAQIRQYGELMRNEGRRLTDMVEQILEFAGIQSGQRGFALRPVAIEPLLRDIVSSSAALIDEAGLTVDFNVPSGLPPVLGDEPALRRAFQNLIDNAVKYGAGGGWIGITGQQTGSVVRITVADRGIGIDAAEQERIFDPFYRTAEVVLAQTQGAGLGLSLVQRIVLAHNGRVTVKSTPKAGSEFTIELPAAGEEPLGERAATDQSAAAAL